MKNNMVENSPFEQLEHLCRELAMPRSEFLSLAYHRERSDLVVTFTPHNSRAAKIELRLDPEFGVYLMLGQASPFEVPFTGGYHTRKSWLNEVEAFCLAVMKGNFEEKVIKVAGEIRGSDHQVLLPNGKKIVEHWRKGIIAPWSVKEIEFLKYEPY